jgi:hypothetical protein
VRSDVATSDEVLDSALDLAERGVETEAAVRELLSCCGDHRVSVVRARQSLADREDGRVSTERALELIELVLDRGEWA